MLSEAGEIDAVSSCCPRSLLFRPLGNPEGSAHWINDNCRSPLSELACRGDQNASTCLLHTLDGLVDIRDAHIVKPGGR